MQNTQEFIDPDFLGSPYEGEGRSNKAPQPQISEKPNGLAKIASLLFVVGLFVLPFIFVPIPGWSVPVGKIVLIALLGLSAGAAVLASVQGRSLTLPKTFSASLLGILLLMSVSLAFSESFSSSLFGANLEVGTFLTTAIALMLALVAPLVLDTRQKLFTSLAAILGGGLVLALFHLIRFIFGAESLALGHFFDPSMSLVGSWYDLGVFFGVTYLISLSALVFGSFPTIMRTLLGVALAVSLLFVGLVNLPVLTITLIVTTVALIAASVLNKSKPLNFSLIGSLVLLVLFMVLVKPIGSFVEGGLGVLHAELRPTWPNTQEMLGAGFSSAKNVVVGKGPNTFAYLWQEARAQEVINSDYWWPLDFSFSSGIIPTFSVTYGLLVVGAMLAFAGYLAFSVVKVIVQKETDSLLSSIVVISGVPAVFLWVLSIFYVFSVVPFLLMFILSGIAIAALTQMGRVSTITLSNRNTLGSTLGLVGAVVCVILIVPMFVVGTSRTLYGQGVTLMQTADDIETVVAAQRKINQASQLERNDSFARLETEFALLRLQEFISREDLDEGDVAEYEAVAFEIQAAAMRAIAFNPRNYSNYVSAGLVFETLGLLAVENAYEAAAAMYEEAARLNPTNPALPLMSARLEILREDKEAALAFAQKSLEIKYNYPDAFLFLADVELAEGNVKTAIEQLEVAVETLPSNVFLLNELGVLYYSEKDYDKAISLFSESLVLDSENANARYFRALSYIYGKEDTAAALKDLEKVRVNNPENETLAAVIANVKAGKDPLDGIEIEEEVVPNEGGAATTNIDAARELESGGEPEVGTNSGASTSTNTSTSTTPNTTTEEDTDEE